MTAKDLVGLEAMTTEMLEMDEFDVLLNDVLRTVANPELPERVRVNVQTRVWVREMTLPTSQKRDAGHPAVVFAPEVFLAQMSPKRDARSATAAVLMHVAAILLLFLGARAIHVQDVQKAMQVTATDDSAADGPGEGHDGRRRWTAWPYAGEQGTTAEVC